MSLVLRRLTATALGTVLVAGALALGAPISTPPAAAAGSNSVTDWSLISQDAVIVGRPAGSAVYLHAIVLIAMHDAVVAVDGGADPLISAPIVTRPADGDAAVAAAAHDVLVARVPAQAATVQQEYDDYLAAIPDGPAKSNGVAVGQAAAAAVLADRADDRFDQDPDWVQPTPGPGVFEPVLPTKPVDIKLGGVKPIALPRDDDGTVADSFLPGPPPSLTSDEYAADFNEVKALGRATGSTRTPEQTETALFWSENTPRQWNRTLRELAISKGFDRVETARLLAMAFVSSADSLIVCFAAKYHYVFWRPVHAIQRADTDGNPATEPDPEWQSRLVVNHPEYPSGHSCASGGVIPALEEFFGTSNVEVTVSSTVTGTSRTYPSFKAIGRDISAARIYGGLHFRFSMGVGFSLAKHVARHVLTNYFTTNE
jgi:PAP2 superfamily